MSTELPFGQGQWVVWGILTTERDDNRGLTSKQQDITTREIPVYRTDSEEEARRLVREGGFEHNRLFYATTRVSNTRAAEHKEHVQNVSGVLKRDDPKYRR